METDFFAIIYKDKRTGLSGMSPEVYKEAESELDLIKWYESRHIYAEVTAIVPLPRKD